MNLSLSEDVTQRREGFFKFFASSRLCVFALIFCLQGCGYQWHEAHNKPTLSVPFITGDEDGTLTNEVIRSLSRSGIANVHSNGEYLLKIAFKDTNLQNIGYRLDKQKVDGKISKNIVPCEGRKSVTLEVSLYERPGGDPLFGPCIISSDADYDFIDGDSIRELLFINPDGIPTTVLPFSLGQLEPVEAAQEAASRPLNQQLARKITEFVFLSLSSSKSNA